MFGLFWYNILLWNSLLASLVCLTLRLYFSLLSSHQEASTLETSTETGDILTNGQIVLVPLVVEAELFARQYLTSGKQSNRVVEIGVDLPCQVEWDNIRVTTVIDKASLVTIKHAVEAQWKELAEVNFLNNLLPLVSLGWIVEIEQVRKTICIVICTPHVALLLAHNFTKVLHEESASWNFFHRNETPHRYILTLGGLLFWVIVS